MGEARRIADRLVSEDPDSLRAREARRQVLEEQGELAEAVLEARRTGRLTAGRNVDEVARRLAQDLVTGRLAVADSRWLPGVACPPGAIVDPRPDRIVHLVGPSLPYQEDPFTVRHHRVVEAQRADGLDPIVVTSLGFPRRLGIRSVPAREVVGQVAHDRLDLGPGYRLDGPSDRYLDDEAWLPSRIIRRERPTILHVTSRSDELGEILVGIALRSQLGLALVWEIRPANGSNDGAARSDAAVATAGDLERAVLVRCLGRVDHLIVGDEADRDGLVALGFPAGTVSVIPVGVEPGGGSSDPSGSADGDPTLGARYGAVYDGVAAAGQAVGGS